MEIKSVRGVRDLLPHQAEKLRYIEKVCREVVEKYGFVEIILPTIEEISLYQHSIGQTSDIVVKQMFEIVNRDEDSNKKLVLRPEGTAGVVRAFVEHNFKNNFPLKRFFYFGQMFRYERPQKGRFREFYQFGIEIFNEPQIASDLVLINIINKILTALKVKYDLEINSIGCKKCREEFEKILIKKLSSLKLCDVCKDRLNKNPLRIFDCKIDAEKLKEKFSDELNIQNYLCNTCRNSFERILDAFNKQGIRYKINPMLVRGLDYYNGFVFEYKTEFLDAAQNTLCAGGRYDGLLYRFLKEDVYACGAAFGIDRIMEVINIDKKENLKVGIAVVDDKYLLDGFNIGEELVNCFKDIVIVGPFSGKSLKSQLRLFNNENCKYVLLIGDEIKENKVVVKDFINKTQQTVEMKKLKEIIL